MNGHFVLVSIMLSCYFTLTWATIATDHAEHSGNSYSEDTPNPSFKACIHNLK